MSSDQSPYRFTISGTEASLVIETSKLEDLRCFLRSTIPNIVLDVGGNSPSPEIAHKPPYISIVDVIGLDETKPERVEEFITKLKQFESGT